jgi:chromosome partitioning protein
MKSIMIYNSKGGSGKTTLAVNLAAYYAKAGIPTTIVDLDPQQSSMQWLGVRPMSKPKISGTKKFNKLVKRAKNAVVIYDLPAAIHGNKLTSYIKKANIVVVPVLPSPIDMKAAKEFIQSLRAMGSVIRNRVQIGLVANRCRAHTNIFLELDSYLLKEKGIKYVTAFRDNTNYLKSARSGLGIFEMGEAMTAQDREEWKPLISWMGTK